MKHILLLLAFMLFLVGCTQPYLEKDVTFNPVQKVSLYGDGSSTVFPIIRNSMIEFEKTQNVYDITVKSSGSGEGIQKLIEKEVNFTYSSKQISAAEYALAEANNVSLVATPIAFDILAIIVNVNNPLAEISQEEIKKIFVSGEINDWSQLTFGIEGNISVYGSNLRKSGTSAYFFGILGENKTSDAYVETEKSSDVISYVANDPLAIGYISKAYLTDEVHELSISGVDPSRINAIKGTYPFTRFLYFVTDGEPEGVYKDYIDFMHSPDAKYLVENLGYISVN